MVRRIYVEKKAPYAGAAGRLADDLRGYLGLKNVTGVRLLIRYDVENVSDDTFEAACKTVFSEPPVDILYRMMPELSVQDRVFSVEALPGQYDQRADSAEQCIRFIKEDEEPIVRTAVTYIISGAVSDGDMNLIKEHFVNPVDSRIADEAMPSTLVTLYEEPEDVRTFDGFCSMNDEAFHELYESLNLAMTFSDFEWIKKYFSDEEHRDPTVTEIRVLDTYWSDHCRHSTFTTAFTDFTIGEGAFFAPVKAAYDKYISARKEVYGDKIKEDEKYICLMDIALMGMKKLKKDGILTDQEDSEENNACSVVVPIETDEGKEEWLVFFKNETHNHPTEIEPFGGAATCLGGAIRDPLSGRGYVYQAMRITGAADPRVPVSDTMKGKLPQKKIVKEAAAGYSSYGNQIGLATGYVNEIYHPDYVAKRMEIGAVMGAAPRAHVVRKSPEPGDVIILLGGRTGRDGCGGATGSSKAHDLSSLTSCGAEVQKGNAPTERKLQRLFRRPEVSEIIKKCNDFGAGGVSVAIGELAPGLFVELDKVPKKYAGLDGTELAISESQERMAVVVSKSDEERFMGYASEENLEATTVAHVTKEPRLVLNHRGKNIVNISRAFLDTNGAMRKTKVHIDIPEKDMGYLKDMVLDCVKEAVKANDLKNALLKSLSDLNVCSKRGLVEMFDSSIGAGTVLMPFGGKRQMTPIQTMAAALPVYGKKTDAATLMSYGFDPYLSKYSPYHGAVYAVTMSAAKVVCAGGRLRDLHLTFQEYFKKVSDDPASWSEPAAALLGAFDAQLGFKIAAIGGKDSMSGSFNDIGVPPTLVSFAVGVTKKDRIISPEFKKPGNAVIRIIIPRDEYGLPEYEKVTRLYDMVTDEIGKGGIISAYCADAYGVLPGMTQMAFGNGIGLNLADDLTLEELFKNASGDILAEVPSGKKEDILKSFGDSARLLAFLKDEEFITYKESDISLGEAYESWTKPLEGVFPVSAGDHDNGDCAVKPFYREKNGQRAPAVNKGARPRVFIPVFPGTNCEYDSAAAFEKAGAEPVVKVFRNAGPHDIRASVREFANAVRESQMIMFPGGFSAGDEPDGSAKFFATAFRNEELKEAVNDLLKNRDGLALGICNGFQAMIKLGLVPFGEILEQDEDSPTLTFNTIGRHISRMAYIKIASDLSPWLALTEPGKVYANPASHGEGRFVAPESVMKNLIESGRIATQYCDPDGNVSMNDLYNLNGSYLAIEGITSPDGRCLGKMAHAERIGERVAVNICGDQNIRIFEAGVKYFCG